MKINLNDPASPCHSMANGELAVDPNKRGLPIRAELAAKIEIDDTGYTGTAIEEIMGKPRPQSINGNFLEYTKYWAEFRAKLRLIEADALINELNKEMN